MLTLPEAIIPILQPFSTLFQRRTWVKAQVLLVGAVLAPRKRTVTSALRVMGLSDDDGFAIYHHVLNRAVFSSLRRCYTSSAMIPYGPSGAGSDPRVN